MSYPQILETVQVTNTPEEYIDKEYEVNCASKLLVAPNKRIMKITNNPSAGLVLYCNQLNSGTVADPDELRFGPSASLLPTYAISRTSILQPINPIAGTQISGNLNYDTSSGQFGTNASSYLMPFLSPSVYNVSCNGILTLGASAQKFSIRVRIIADNGLAPVTIAENSVYVNSVMLAGQQVVIGCAGQWVTSVAGVNCYVVVDGNYIDSEVYPEIQATLTFAMSTQPN